MAALQTLNDLFVSELKDLYSAEHQLIKALPKMVKTADNMQLRDAFASHLSQTEEHARRIEEIFSAGLEGTPRGKKCAAMEGLVEEGKEVTQGRRRGGCGGCRADWGRATGGAL